MIFGTGSAAFIFNGVTCSLDYSNTTYNWQLPDIQEDKAILTGDMYYTIPGDYAEFTTTIHLGKYADPSAKARELLVANHQDVLFLPHKDGRIMNDGSGSNVYFNVNEIKFFYLNDTTFFDAVQIKFKPRKYISVSGSIK